MIFPSNLDQQILLVAREFIEMRRLFERGVYILSLLSAGAFKGPLNETAFIQGRRLIKEIWYCHRFGLFVSKAY